MKRPILLLAAIALIAATASFGSTQPVGAQGCSYANGTVDCYGWQFDYAMSTASVTPTGLTLNNIVYDDDAMAYQAHFASLPVRYDDDACGPYVDLFSTVSNSEPLGVQGGTFQQGGVNWLELGAHYQIGSYVLYTAFYFSDQGEMQMRMFGRGLQCNVHHVHYPMFVVDADVQGPNTVVGADGGIYHGTGDQVFYNNGGTWTQQTSESDNDVADVGHDFIVRDPDSGKTVSINYDDGIFAAPTGDSFDPQAAINNRIYTRQSNGAAELAWPGAVPGRDFLSGSSGFNGGDWGYNDGEALGDPVVVVRGFLDHAISASLPDDWHTSGIRVKFVDDPFDGEPNPTPTPTPGGPNPDTQLENGVPVTGISADKDDELRYVLDVPGNATSYTVAISGDGDADLYTRMGTEPTRETYDCRPYEGNSEEACTRAVPPSGELHIMIRAYTDISNIGLTATYQATSGPTPTATPTPAPATPTPTASPTPTSLPGGNNELSNGVPITGLQAPIGDELLFTFDVPAGATSYTIAVTGDGDADLHTRMGGQASRFVYDCRPYINGSNESCTRSVPPSGQVSILLHAYSEISDVQLTATYGGGGEPAPTATATPTPPPSEQTPTPTSAPGGDNQIITSGQNVPNLAGSAGQVRAYKIEVPAGSQRLRVTLDVGTGDADLYVRTGQAPSLSVYDCRSIRGGSNNETCDIVNPDSGTYHIMVRGYSAYTATALQADIS